jgi:hypothetical protein
MFTASICTGLSPDQLVGSDHQDMLPAFRGEAKFPGRKKVMKTWTYFVTTSMP